MPFIRVLLVAAGEQEALAHSSLWRMTLLAPSSQAAGLRLIFSGSCGCATALRRKQVRAGEYWAKVLLVACCYQDGRCWPSALGLVLLGRARWLAHPWRSLLPAGDS